MRTSEPDLPPLKTVQAALRKTSEALACELAHPCGEAPDWTPFEWRIARAVAVLHGVCSLLSRRSRWRSPSDWVSFLAEQTSHTEVRHLRLEALLRLIHERSRAAGVAFVALKGAALHRMGFYAPGERPMADLDLLVGAGDLERMARVLEAIHLRQTAVTWKHRVFEPAEALPPATFGEHFANGIKIDLHMRIREILPLRPVEVSGLILPAQPRPGLNPYRSTAALMAHLLLHAAGAAAFRTLRLVQLHDLALLSARMSEEDWDQLLGPIGRQCGLWWALSPLVLLQRYYDAVPGRVLAAAARECPWPLRRSCHQQLLWKVSFSDLGRRAFPGIEWSRSPGDVLAYLAERTVISAQVLARALIPGSTALARSGCPGRGDVRWLAWRPARPATLNAVRHALAQPPGAEAGPAFTCQ